MGYEAKVLADSVFPAGVRLTTLEVTSTSGARGPEGRRRRGPRRARYQAVDAAARRFVEAERASLGKSSADEFALLTAAVDA